MSGPDRYWFRAGMVIALAIIGMSVEVRWKITEWRHQMECFSALLALCDGNSLVIGEFPSQRPVTQSLNFFICAWTNGWASITGEFPSQRPVTQSLNFFYLRLNQRLSKQSRRRSFETPSYSFDCGACCGGHGGGSGWWWWWWWRLRWWWDGNRCLHDDDVDGMEIVQLSMKSVSIHENVLMYKNRFQWSETNFWVKQLKPILTVRSWSMFSAWNQL